VVANGRVYVATFSQQLVVYGLLSEGQGEPIEDWLQEDIPASIRPRARSTVVLVPFQAGQNGAVSGPDSCARPKVVGRTGARMPRSFAGRLQTPRVQRSESGRAERSAVLQFKDRVFSVAFSSDTHWMAAGAWDGDVQLLDLTDPA